MNEIKAAPPEIRKRVDEEPDYVAVRHHGNSLSELVDRYPDGVPAHIEARALGRTEAQVRAMWALTMRQLRRIMGIKKNE